MSARDDYPKWRSDAIAVGADMAFLQWEQMCREIDRLRVELDAAADDSDPTPPHGIPRPRGWLRAVER